MKWFNNELLTTTKRPFFIFLELPFLSLSQNSKWLPFEHFITDRNGCFLLGMYTFEQYIVSKCIPNCQLYIANFIDSSTNNFIIILSLSSSSSSSSSIILWKYSSLWQSTTIATTTNEKWKKGRTMEKLTIYIYIYITYLPIVTILDVKINLSHETTTTNHFAILSSWMKECRGRMIRSFFF